MPCERIFFAASLKSYRRTGVLLLFSFSLTLKPVVADCKCTQMIAKAPVTYEVTHVTTSSSSPVGGGQHLLLGASLTTMWRTVRAMCRQPFTEVITQGLKQSNMAFQISQQANQPNQSLSRCSSTLDRAVFYYTFAYRMYSMVADSDTAARIL